MTDANPGPRLREAQLRLRELITAPSGARPEASAQEARTLLRGDSERSADARLEVYRHAWFHRIHGALAGDFGALARVLGEDAFRELVREYLSAHPPHRPSLRDAGAKLPDFLAESPATAGLRDQHAFAPDLARLEWALVEAFDAADAESLPRAALAAIAPERWSELRFRFQPALRLLALGFPVERVRTAHDAENAELPAPLEPLPTQICVCRKDERVYYRALAPLEAEALGQALAGAPFGRLCEGIAARLSAGAAPARAAALLETWQAEGWLARSTRSG